MRLRSASVATHAPILNEAPYYKNHTPKMTDFERYLCFLATKHTLIVLNIACLNSAKQQQHTYTGC